MGKVAYQNENKCNVIHDRVQGSTDTIDVYTCLCQVYDKTVYHYLQLYQQYEKGVMPYSGGSLEQNCVFVSLMARIHAVVNEVQEEQRKKDEAKAKAKRGK